MVIINIKFSFTSPQNNIYVNSFLAGNILLSENGIVKLGIILFYDFIMTV